MWSYSKLAKRFGVSSGAVWGWLNKRRLSVKNRAWRAANQEYIAVSNKTWRQSEGAGQKRRRKKPIIVQRGKGCLFAIAWEDVYALVQTTEHCPACGCRLVYSGNHGDPHNASLDRVIPSLGYVPGNVAVICFWCNEHKNGGCADDTAAVIRGLRVGGDDLCTPYETLRPRHSVLARLRRAAEWAGIQDKPGSQATRRTTAFEKAWGTERRGVGWSMGSADTQ